MKNPSRIVEEVSNELPAEQLQFLLDENIVSRDKKNSSYLSIDCDKLMKYDNELYEYMLECPEEFLEKLEDFFDIFERRIMLSNFEEEKIIRNVRASDIGKLMNFKGVIKRSTTVIPRVKKIKYECPSCGALIEVEQNSKKQRKPSRCSCGRKGNFKVVEREIINIQEINLEEMPSQNPERQPQQIRVLLEKELTEEDFSGIIQPGKRVNIIGIVKRVPKYMRRKENEENLADFMIKAISLHSLEEEEGFEITEEDERQIREIASDKPLGRLGDSLCPEIYGQEMVKKALVLQSVKGVSKKNSDGSWTREDIHILLSGDPSVGKSRLLNAAKKKIPKSKFVVGSKATAAGIVAMALKDEMTGDWALESGALVQASGSVLALDELDKMEKDYLADLYEPMSSGTVTVDKADISASLPGRTSIMAAANPTYGNFDIYQPLAKQIDLPSPLLNRFDLVFIMKDNPDEEKDKKAARHLLKTHSTNIKPKIDPDIFKKYIYYARKYKPEFPEELEEGLVNFYVNLRKRSKGDEEEGLPITLRNVEGILRLAEASSKIRLNKKVDKEDTRIAKDIFLHCLKQIGIDTETGIIDMSKKTEKVPVSKRGKIRRLRALMKNLENRLGKLLPVEEIKEASDIPENEIYDYLEKLSQSGEIIQPKKGYYQLIG